MANHYSRKTKIENKKNLRSAFVYGILTIVVVALLFFYGLPAIVNFSAFLGDIKKSGEPVTTDDTTPPAPPKVDNFEEYTNEYTVDISGTAEAGSTVIVTFNSKESELLVNKDGNFTKNFELRDGNNIFSLIARDSSGNESQESDTFKIVFDNVSPSLTISKPESGSQYYGSSQRQMVIEGSTDEDANVTINDRFVSVSDDGNFTFATTLSDGDNTFNIKVEDYAGNSEETSLSVNFTP